MLFINFAGKGTNKRVIIQIYTVFLSFLTVFIYSEQKASPVGATDDFSLQRSQNVFFSLFFLLFTNIS